MTTMPAKMDGETVVAFIWEPSSLQSVYMTRSDSGTYYIASAEWKPETQAWVTARPLGRWDARSITPLEELSRAAAEMYTRQRCRLDLINAVAKMRRTGFSQAEIAELVLEPGTYTLAACTTVE